MGQGRSARKIDAVGLSGQMHSSVFLDRANRVIRPALLWCDGRTTAECREITQRVGEQSLRAWVSNPALEGFTLPKILWLRNHEPAAFERLAKVLLPKDYLRLQLTGALATELSDASGTLLLDVANRRWSREMLDAMELSPDLLPEVGRSTEVLGTISAAAARATGLTAGTPVVGGGADNACGAVGRRRCRARRGRRQLGNLGHRAVPDRRAPRSIPRCAPTPSVTRRPTPGTSWASC